MRGPAAVPVDGGRAWPKRDQRRPIRGRYEACGARLRCPWTAAGPGRNGISAARSEATARPAGPGRASRRRAERSSQRGRRAGGPPPTGTPSRPVPTGAPHGNPKSGGTSRKKWWPPGKPGDHHSCVHLRELTSRSSVERLVQLFVSFSRSAARASSDARVPSLSTGVE